MLLLLYTVRETIDLKNSCPMRRRRLARWNPCMARTRAQREFVKKIRMSPVKKREKEPFSTLGKMKVPLIAVLMFAVMQIAAAASLYFAGFPAESERTMKRSMPTDPDWNQLGWAWGKRSGVALNEIPRRLVRALHPVKKNPDWQDLGFAWGRR
ncbi:unnamed protein product [Caenorhabditis sp. 36 PRJEB53466]|nr:unnamed protein product [Caenorhabditis sp. 36 PRJEB53466]